MKSPGVPACINTQQRARDRQSEFQQPVTVIPQYLCTISLGKRNEGIAAFIELEREARNMWEHVVHNSARAVIIYRSNSTPLSILHIFALAMHQTGTLTPERCLSSRQQPHTGGDWTYPKAHSESSSRNSSVYDIHTSISLHPSASRGRQSKENMLQALRNTLVSLGSRGMQERARSCHPKPDGSATPDPPYLYSQPSLDHGIAKGRFFKIQG